MTDALKRLTTKRTVVRKMTQTLLDKMRKEFKDEPLDFDQVEVSLGLLRVNEEELRPLDTEIEELVELSELENEITCVLQFREEIEKMKVRAELLIRNKDEDRSSSTFSNSGNSKNISIKLPRLNIEKFYGDSINWQNFWAQFSSSIHENESLCKVDKFNYLKSLIGGTAASAIAGLKLSDPNYDSAIEILTKRFGRRDLVITAHMNQLLKIAPIRKSSELSALRRMYDTCEAQIRSLESLGIVSGTYSSFLCPILLRILPEDIALEITRRRADDDDWELTILLTQLRKEIECRERSQLLKNIEEGDHEKDSVSKKQKEVKFESKKGNKEGQNKIATATALTTTTTEAPCFFCEQTTHRADDCTIKSVAERKDIVQKQGRCFVCLRRNHIARMCRSRKRCAKCGRRHNQSVCDSDQLKSNKEESTTVVASITPPISSGNSIHLQTARVGVKGLKQDLVTRCLLDTGSERTFVKQELSRRLDLPVVGKETLSIHVFGSNKIETSEYNRVSLVLYNVKEPDKYIKLEAVEVPEICTAMIQVTSYDLVQRLRELDLDVADSPSAKSPPASAVDIIIGTDHYWSVVTTNSKRLEKTLVAIETLFGWSVHGTTPMSTVTGICKPTITMKIKVESLPSEEELASVQLTKFWELDAIGIQDESANAPGGNDLKILEDFNNKIEFTGERYRVSLPWKLESKEFLEDNFQVAEIRFRNLVTKFKNNPIFYDQYKQTIEGYLNLGIIEPLSQNYENLDEKMPVYFLPHRAVIKEDRSTTKLRIVFDASSKKKGAYSLNDCLHIGPKLNPDLFQLLIEFRSNKIAFCADIQSAFLQIELSEQDREVARFLWCEDPFVKREELKIQVMRLTRVLFGVSSSPFLLAATLKHHLSQYKDKYPETYEMLNKLYVDDLISGADSENDANTRYLESNKIMQAAGMTLRKWVSNSANLQTNWNNEINLLEAKTFSVSNENKETNLKVLGIAWNTSRDTFYFDFTQLLNFLLNRVDTKRFILQASGRIYDPVGYLSPFTLRVKIIFQKLWSLGIDWDDRLPEALQQQWGEWCDEIADLKELGIPRYHFRELGDQVIHSMELHGFGDASEKAYSTVIYLRTTTKDGQIFTSFVCSKSRVAPLKRVSLPRLELLGALLTAKIGTKIMGIFRKFHLTCYFWTDSIIVYYWLRGAPKSFKPFVENRVHQIRTLTDPQDWSHCPGIENPADLATRGLKMSNLTTNKLWWQGPEWLRQHQDTWPTIPSEKAKGEEAFCCELRNGGERGPISLSTAVSEINPLFQLKDHSSATKVFKITAWIMRFLFNLKPNVCQRKTSSLSLEEIDAAESYWIRANQRIHFQNEVEALNDGQTVSTNSKLYSLNPYLDEQGIMRLGGRLQHSTFREEAKHPAILLGLSELAKLLINRAHLTVLHAGVADTLSLVRQRYWLTKGRQSVRKIVYACLICRKFSSKPGKQQTAPLPKDRIQESPPFQVSGVDFAGPLYTRGSKKQNEKAYVALFTCATTRAIHLELVSNLSAECFILALKRFISRRGVCQTLLSDNAKTFKRTERDLNAMYKCVESDQAQDFLKGKTIKWKYIVESAPFWGGFWERLVRSTKTCMKKVLGRAHLSFEELSTLLCEIEAVLNSRPITYVYDDSNEPEPLSPAHFLSGRSLILNYSLNTQEPSVTSNKEELSKRIKYRRTLLKSVWRNWRKQYLQDLRSAHHLTHASEESGFKIGEVVLLGEEIKNKMLWKMGIVVNIFPGRDGKVRACAVRLANKSVIKRPVQVLYRLEVGETNK